MGVAVGGDVVKKTVGSREVVLGGVDWWEESWQTAVRTERSSALA